MGEELLKMIIQSTGLSEELVAVEVKRLIAKAGLSQSELTIDDIRAILSDYVQDVLLDAKKDYDANKEASETAASFTHLFPLD